MYISKDGPCQGPSPSPGAPTGLCRAASCPVVPETYHRIWRTGPGLGGLSGGWAAGGGPSLLNEGGSEEGEPPPPRRGAVGTGGPAGAALPCPGPGGRNSAR